MKFRTFVVLFAALAAAPAQTLAQGREVTVGMVSPFTGPQGPTGKGLRAGIQLYFDHVNAAGGVNGTKLRLVSHDDGYRPPDTVRLFKEVIAAEKPIAFIATVGTANIELLTKERVLVDSNIALIGAASGASSMTSQPNVFVTKATHHDEVAKLFSILISTGVNRVGVVYQDDPFGVDVLVGAEKAAAKAGIQITVKASYPRNTTDMKAAVEAVLKANPPTVYLGAITTATIEFIKEYRGRGGDAQIYGLSVNDGPAIVAKLGADLARGFAYGTVVPPASAKDFSVVREYLDLAGKSKDADINGRSLEGFIAAKALVSAMRRAKTLTPPAVTQAIAGTTKLDLGNYMIDFSDKQFTGSRWVDFAILDSRGRIIR